MTIIYNPSSTIDIKGFGTSPDFTITLNKTTTESNGLAAGSRSSGDKILTTYDNVGSIPSYTVQVTSGNSLGTITYTSKTPDVFIVDQTNTLRILSAGIGTLRVCTKYGCSEVTVDFSTGVIAEQERISGYEPDSLGNAIWNASIPRLRAASYGATTQMQFTTLTKNRPLTSNTVTPNPNFILADVDLSFISVLKDYPAAPEANFPVMLISPRHFIAAAHVNSDSPGMQYLFRRQNGTLVAPTQVHATNISGTDISIGYLDQDVTGIAFAGIFGPDFFNKVNNWVFTDVSTVNLKTSGLPAFNRQYNATLSTDPVYPYNNLPANPKIAAKQVLGATNIMYMGNSIYIPVEPTLANWGQAAFSGDSSSPCFCLVPQQGGLMPVLYTSLFGAGGGPEFAYYRTQILSKMHEIAVANGDNRTYTLRTPDLSAYRNYA